MTTGSRSNLRALLAIALTAGVCVPFLAWRWRAQSQTELDTALAEHASVARQVREVGLLALSRSTIEDRPSPETDLIARIESQLITAGASASSLQSLRSAEPIRIPGTPLLRQQAGMTLSALDAQTLGRFLAGWREAQPLWIVRSVRMEFASRAESESDERGSIHLTLEHTHLNPAGVDS